MMVSTKGRYALRIMIDLAERPDNAVPLSDIAKRQEISEKYLESIAALLVRGGLVSATRGKGGGYRLVRGAGEITALDVLKTTEGFLAPVSCLSGEKNTCKRAGCCRTLWMWEELGGIIDSYLSGVTLSDLVLH